MIIVTYRSEVLGTGEFWRGDESEITAIRNIPARRLAEQVVKYGGSRSAGMWTVSKSNPIPSVE